MKRQIINFYLNFAKNNQYKPSLNDFKINKIGLKQIKENFGSIEQLNDYIKEKYSERLEKYYISEDDIFTKKHIDELSSDIKKYKRFVITTAVHGKKAFVPFYKSIKSYCEKNNAKLLLIPCADVFSKFTNSPTWYFDPIFSNEHFIFKETKLNDKLFICSIKLSAKQIQPTTGLSRIGQRNGSYIFSSPKQSLEFIIKSQSKNSSPLAIMTPGAITMPQYGGDKYMSERISYIAENDHIFGAIIVEIEDNKKFHFRQIQADKKGSFIDLGQQYNHLGSVKEISCDLVMGDFHAMESDQNVLKATENICKELNVKNIFLHDFFSGVSICHHEFENIVKLSLKSNNKNLDLEKELKYGGREINRMHNWINGNLIMVKSNHDEWLNRYLENNWFIEDPNNYYISCDLVRKMIDGEDPLKYAYEKYGNIINKNRIIWLNRDSEYKIANIEMAAHGDIGINGSRGNLYSIEKAFGEAVIAHAHTGAILRGVFRVGTSTGKMSYQSGPSSWTNTHCLVYPNGSRQLINMINGQWKII